MQQSIDQDVLDAILTCTPGTPAPPLAGVTAVPLLRPNHLEPPPSSGSGELSSPAIADVDWHEVPQVHPRRVLARNRSAHPVLIDVGCRLEGGMATRAVARTVVLRPGTATAVAVQPVGSRWWNQGPLHPTGRVHPVVTALIMHGAIGPNWLASSSHTLLTSSVAATEEEAGLDDAHSRPFGFLLRTETGVIAAWVLWRPPWLHPPLKRSTDHNSSAAVVERSVYAVLAGAVGQGRLRPHLAAAGPWGCDFVLSSPDTRLIDSIVLAA